MNIGVVSGAVGTLGSLAIYDIGFDIVGTLVSRASFRFTGISSTLWSCSAIFISALFTGSPVCYVGTVVAGGDVNILTMSSSAWMS